MSFLSLAVSLPLLGVHLKRAGMIPSEHGHSSSPTNPSPGNKIIFLITVEEDN
jgi:hypothetical protein